MTWRRLCLVGVACRQDRGDVAFKHLRDQVECIHDFANPRDAAIAKGIERRDVELHDAVVAARKNARMFAATWSPSAIRIGIS